MGIQREAGYRQFNERREPVFFDRPAVVMEVIRTELKRVGKGVPGDVARVVVQYWTLDGQLLASVDPFAHEECLCGD